MLIPNKLNITYNVPTPDGKKILKSAESNTVITEILTYAVLKEIRSDKTSVPEGETFRVTVTVTNNSATEIFDNFLKVPKPDGADFIAGSVKINGVPQPDYDAERGFPLPDLSAGEKAVIEYDLKATAPVTVTHSAKLSYAVTDPARGKVNYSENTQTLSVKVISDKISVVKSVDKSFAVKGEKLHYTVKITNTGNITKTQLVFKDPIPYGTTFVTNSVKINGASYSLYNPATGFVLQSLAQGETLTVEFDVKVT